MCEPCAADGVAYQAGEQVTAELSSLLFSKGGVTTGDATVSLGGTVLGTAPVAFQIVDTLDEQGTATVAFTIPDGVVGSTVLTIGGPGGTAVDLPIEVAAAPEPVGTSTSGSAPLLVWRTSPVDYRVTVKLGKLSRGLHILTAQFTGDGFDRSLSWPSLVLVL